MKRADLSAAVQKTLVRLPVPHDSHYGVVPAAPPETGLILTSIAARHRAAEEALAKVDAYARSLHDPFVVSRILARQEAVSSSAIEGASSTLDEVLAGEEAQDEEARAEVRQVRKYATTVSRFNSTVASGLSLPMNTDRSVRLIKWPIIDSRPWFGPTWTWTTTESPMRGGRSG